jgi:hypothetical protein
MTTNVALSFQLTRGRERSGNWNWFCTLTYIIEESERRGWQVLRHQIADHSPKGSHENKVLHSLQFFKRKEKIVLRFLRPSHVASNFNQKLVQVYMIRREESCWN